MHEDVKTLRFEDVTNVTGTNDLDLPVKPYEGRKVLI